MLRVGLTGGIATGKSTAGEMFVELGCHLIDSDEISHELFRPGQAIYTAVVNEFGNRILAADGTIDRRVLGEIVFKDPAARQRLNGLVHPAIIQRQKEWLREMEAADPQGIAIVSAALMIEVGTYKNYETIIVVTCSPEIQRERLRARTGVI
jgi:dephospho-CoA kinase